MSQDLHLTGKAERTHSDSARGMVHVHRGKGAKDRYLPLPTSTLAMLRVYWSTHRHPRFLFPADGRNHSLRSGVVSQASRPMSETAVQDAIVLITGKLKFGKKVSTHTLRHSFATHLLEAGVSLKAIQRYMGHSSMQTTMVYLHLTQTAEVDARATIEKLFQRQPEQIVNTGLGNEPGGSQPVQPSRSAQPGRSLQPTSPVARR